MYFFCSKYLLVISDPSNSCNRSSNESLKGDIESFSAPELVAPWRWRVETVRKKIHKWRRGMLMVSFDSIVDF
ncbi:hypothetical protein Hanom_Chr14g01270881 [Helianthus anomalus]